VGAGVGEGGARGGRSIVQEKKDHNPLDHLKHAKSNRTDLLVAMM
jgi:hypothetical protein